MNILLAPVLPLAAILGLSPVDIKAPEKALAPVSIPAEAAAETAAPSPVVLPVKADQPAPSVEQQSDMSEQPDLIDEGPVEVSREEILKQATLGLNSAKTAKGVFVQTDTYGARETGEFYIRRPNRIRFEYGSPMRLLVVSDGTTIHYEDMEVETENSAPLKATPLKLFLGEDIDLTTDENVVDVRSLSDRHLVVVEDKRSNADEKVEGQLLLMFARDTYELMGWWALDASGGQTRVDLLQVEKNTKISARLFVIDDDEDDRRR